MVFIEREISEDRNLRERYMEKESLEMQQVLHMKGGMDEESYAKNSTAQNAYQSMSMPLLMQAVIDLCSTNLPESVTIADLGCSSGPNTLFAVSKIMSIIYKRCCQQRWSQPEFAVFLNDLPGNDFNTVFKSLPAFHERMQEENGQDFGPCYVSAVPGSFHGRLFLSKSLNFVHSSSSLHWLSQVPPELNDKANPIINKGKIFISKTSPPAVINSYFSQFQRDFSSFLASRAKEVIPGGRMVLTFRGRRTADPSADESCLLWDYLGQAFQKLVSEGIIDEEKLDSYNTPYYEAYTEDVKSEIKKEGSFTITHLETIVIPWRGVDEQKKYDRVTTTQQTAKAIRAVNESLIGSHFGVEILDNLFLRFCQIMAVDTKEVDHISVVVSLIRKA